MHSPISPRRLTLACALALAIVPATASARSIGVNLRVEATDGSVLADVTQYTSLTKVKTDPKANCFGAGTGGSGKRVKVPNDTALGVLADAARNVSALRPLSLTDHFSFGLGVCGIGGSEPKNQNQFWYLKRNHAGSQVGGAKLKVHSGDSVLWYLAPKFPVGDELALKLPARAKPKTPVTATVLGYSDRGKRTPIAGAKVPFARGTTDSSGHATLEFPKAGTEHVQARHTGDIPSNVVAVCVNADLSSCPAHDGRRIFGSPGPDRIKTTAGPDRVNCGGGRDVVVVRRHDRSDHIAKNCEKVIRR